jgi:probable rRNA maturation factor
MKTKSLKKLQVTLQNRAKQPQTPSKKQFQAWVQASLLNSGKTNEVTIRIVNSTESATLNKKFRHKTGPTNVLSFAYLPIPGEDQVSLGDIVICAELVKQEAEAEHKTLVAHWAHLTVHGVLHLQGYDHIEPQAAQAMEQLEAKILKNLGFTDPYQNMEKD